MKNSFIITIVWIAVIVLVISFGTTIFFLDGNFANKEQMSDEKEIINDTETVYLSDESSIRTNTFADLKDIDLIAKTINQKTETQTEKIERNESGESIESMTNVISFIKPIQGELLKPISRKELIYSKTLNEWKTHNGTDYKASLGQEVFSVFGGKVKQIGFNYEYGNFIIIEHGNGYESLYSNITVLDEIKENTPVEKGQIIGLLAESFGFEVADETHLHFELKKDGEYVEIIL